MSAINSPEEMEMFLAYLELKRSGQAIPEDMQIFIDKVEVILKPYQAYKDDVKTETEVAKTEVAKTEDVEYKTGYYCFAFVVFLFLVWAQSYFFPQVCRVWT